MTELAFDQEIETFLALCKTATLATVDTHGNPCAANIQYAHGKAWRLYWVSGSSTTHSVNIERTSQAALAIYAHQDEPEMIHGLQMRGVATAIDRIEDAGPRAIYTAKYPFVADPPYDRAIERQRFYCFAPTWLRWIDNRRGFGWKIEKTIER